ncbi:TPA: thiol-disulfide isomerase [Pseudomonas putida]|nr:thiol-disulfide isomerase [Pseudomonas putida]
MNSRTIKSSCTAIVLLVGVAILWQAYTTFQSRYLRPFDNQATLFDGSQLRLPFELAGPGPIRVVHFWDPACPCNVGNQQHLADLVSHFAGDGVSFHVLQKPGSHGQLPANLTALKPLASLPGSEHLPASPAVAIWDRQGHLAYFGPYSEGAVCNASNSFIEPILKALLDNRQVTASNTLAVGCYCPWDG